MKTIKNPLPALNDAYPLDLNVIEFFQQQGYAFIPQLLRENEVNAFQKAIKDTVVHYSDEQRPLHERDTYGKAFLQIFNLWLKSEEVKRFTLARRFAGVAAALLGVDKVRIYHDQALFKEPGGGFTPWHQDQYYWPLETDKTITLWMPMVDITHDMGILTFAGGSHKEGFTGHISISDESQEIIGRIVAEKKYKVWAPPLMRAGDATFHLGWTYHWAPSNTSSKLREVMTVIYFANGTRVKHPDNPHREADLRNWLPGCKPGDLAASPLNPLV
jgi:ectoine hydroxylase-related dioxygenase (phytanoyl-CoA dioxygenase family)